MPAEASHYAQPEIRLEPAIDDVGPERGPSVTELQRALTDAFAPSAEPQFLPAHSEPADERLVRAMSRVAGYVGLAAGLIGLAWLVFRP